MKRIPDLCGWEAKGMTTVTISFEAGDAGSSIIRRRAQRPRRDKDLDKISQLLRGSVSDYLIAETNYFVFNSVFYGEPLQLLEKGFARSAYNVILQMKHTAILHSTSFTLLPAQTSPAPHTKNSNNAHCRTHTHIDKTSREECRRG